MMNFFNENITYFVLNFLVICIVLLQSMSVAIVLDGFELADSLVFCFVGSIFSFL